MEPAGATWHPQEIPLQELLLRCMNRPKFDILPPRLRNSIPIYAKRSRAKVKFINPSHELTLFLPQTRQASVEVQNESKSYTEGCMLCAIDCRREVEVSHLVGLA